MFPIVTISANALQSLPNVPIGNFNPVVPAGWKMVRAQPVAPAAVQGNPNK